MGAGSLIGMYSVVRRVSSRGGHPGKLGRSDAAGCKGLQEWLGPAADGQFEMVLTSHRPESVRREV
jgi:hypothetical protein